MALEIRRRRVGSGDKAVEIIDVIGRLDTPGGAQLRSAVQEALKEGTPRIAINFAETKEIHRETVGALHSLGRACQRAEGKLGIFGAEGDVLEYLKSFADPSLAPWFPDEKTAIVGVGGELEVEEQDKLNDSPDVVIALGFDNIFRKIFWKLAKMGGMPVAKFDAVPPALDYLLKRKVHSIVLDITIDLHDGAKLVRQIRTTPSIRKVGIFLVGPPSKRSTGKALLQEGADNLTLYSFSGEEIFSKFNPKPFFHQLKEAFAKFEASRKKP